MRVLGLIPARGGSKGIARKNLQRIADKSLIELAVTSARESKMLTYIIGSTEDDEIAQEFERLGCRTVKRPASLSRDDSPIVPAVKHAVMSLREEGMVFDCIILLQTTCPFRIGSDIDSVIEMMRVEAASSVVSVYRVEDNHPARMYRIVADKLVPIYFEPIGRRRQDLEPIYHRNGAIYACKVEQLFKYDSLIDENVKPYIMPLVRSFNIDNEIDLYIARHMYEFIQERNEDPCS